MPWVNGAGTAWQCDMEGCEATTRNPWDWTMPDGRSTPGTCPPCTREFYSSCASVSVGIRQAKRAQRDRVIAAFLDTGASYRETAREVGCAVGTVAGAAERTGRRPRDKLREAHSFITA